MKKKYYYKRPKIRVKFFFTVIFISIFFSTFSAWGANVYIDPSAAYNGDGTLGSQAKFSGGPGAINTWSKIKFSNKDDYYQKCATFERIATRIEIEDIQGTSNNRVIFGAYYLDAGREIIGVSGKKPIISKNDNLSSVVVIKGSTHITIKNLDIRKGETCMWVKSSDYFILENCSIGAGTSRFGIRVRGENNIESGYGIIRNNLIDSQLLTFKQPVYPISGPRLSDAIQFYNTGHHCKIYGNKIMDWGHSGIDFWAKSTSYGNGVSFNEVYENIITSPNGFMRGISYSGLEGYCRDNKIYRNIIKNTQKRNQLGGTYNQFYLNIIDEVHYPFEPYRNIDQAILLQGYGGPVKYNKVYNNILYNTKSHGILLYNNAGDSVVEYNQFINNIISSPGALKYCIKIAPSDYKIKSNFFKNNLMYNNGIVEVVHYCGKVYSSEQFNNVNGNENNLTNDPKFVNPILGEFALNFDSPCIDTGMDVLLKEDFKGTKIPQNFKPDIGAFEKVSNIGLSNPKNFRISTKNNPSSSNSK
jgi:hypothetical protein